MTDTLTTLVYRSPLNLSSPAYRAFCFLDITCATSEDAHLICFFIFSWHILTCSLGQAKKQAGALCARLCRGESDVVYLRILGGHDALNKDGIHAERNPGFLVRLIQSIGQDNNLPAALMHPVRNEDVLGNATICSVLFRGNQLLSERALLPSIQPTGREQRG